MDFRDVSNIVICRDVFRENGTAYIVMDYVDGHSLGALLARRESSGAPFDQREMLAVVLPLLAALKRVHAAGVPHRDIKPSNILIRRTGAREADRPVLIDFGAAKQAVADRTRSFAPYTEGLVAPEQVGDGRLGPWTDIYVVGALMWRIGAGANQRSGSALIQPVKVEVRMMAIMRGEPDPMVPTQNAGAGKFSTSILKAIDRF